MQALIRRATPFIILFCAIAALFVTAPRDGGFWWSDAPRHALDGAFFLDLVRDHPLASPQQYAIDYYVKYPALTVIFYPPLFALSEAVVFRICGVSHASAVMTVMMFYLAAAFGAYLLGRCWFDRWGALAVSLLFIGLPEIALWGRQVMLEIPACAFLIWSSVVLFTLLARPKPLLLYALVLLWLGGLYTKQTTCFLIPVQMGALLLSAEPRTMKHIRRHSVWAAALFVVGVVPLAIVSLLYGRINAASVAGGSWTQIRPGSLDALTFYIRQLPGQLGWAVLAAIGVYVLLLVRRADTLPHRAYLFAWLISGYVLFTAIALKEARHTTVILFPLVILAVQAFYAALPRPYAGIAAVLFAAAVFAHTLAFNPVPRIDGYQTAAAYIASHAPEDGMILFSGQRDGAFIFSLRTHAERGDLSVIRSDKIFLRATERKRAHIWKADAYLDGDVAQEDRSRSEADMAGLLKQYNVSYVVSDDSFWINLGPMQKLQRVIHDGDFLLAASVPVRANVNHPDSVINVYRARYPIGLWRPKIGLDLSLIGTQINEPVGKR